jgi:hypothetical protein
MLAQAHPLFFTDFGLDLSAFSLGGLFGVSCRGMICICREITFGFEK